MTPPKRSSRKQPPPRSPLEENGVVQFNVRTEDHLPTQPGKIYPCFTGGGGACPPADCGRPESYLAGLKEAVSVEAFEDWDTLIEILDQIVLDGRTDPLKGEKTRWRLERPRPGSTLRESRSRGVPS